MNIFYDVVAPEVRTPRDLIRLTNALSVTWPAIRDEVDRADFIGLEALRLFRPAIYRHLRGSKDRICGTGDPFGRSERESSEEMDALLLASVGEKDKQRVKRSLMRLFPRLESVWSNLHYSSDSAVRWSRDRLVCSEKHFESYFRFTIGDDVLPAAELKSIVARASDINFVKAKIHQALNIKRKDGTTKAKLILEELSAHAEEIAEQDVPSLLNVLFQLGDELDVDSDKAGGFSIGDNQLRIHWLLRSLTLDRFDLASRSRFFLKASEDAALGWLVDFSGSSYRDYHPREGKQPEPEQNCLTTAEDAELLQEMALRRIRSASASGELAKTKRLAYLMYSWRELARDDGAEVKAWAAKQMQDDMMIATFSKAFTSYTWSQGLGMAGLGDTVAKRGTRANVDSLDSILDRRYLRERVEQLAAGDQSGNDIKEFLSAWKRHDKNPRD